MQGAQNIHSAQYLMVSGALTGPVRMLWPSNHPEIIAIPAILLAEVI
jgi:hypothetical protein